MNKEDLTNLDESLNSMSAYKRPDGVDGMPMRYSARVSDLKMHCDACKKLSRVVMTEWPYLVYETGGVLVNKRARNNMCVDCFRMVRGMLNAIDTGDLEEKKGAQQHYAAKKFGPDC